MPRPVHISLVCHGNIARSQVLHRYLDRALSERGVETVVFSCGTAPKEAYPNEAELLADVRKELCARGVPGTVARTTWSPRVAETVGASDVILAADEARKNDVVARTGLAADRVQLFYEFIGEGSRDFADTFDAGLGRQDAGRFSRCFDELERIAERVAECMVARGASE